jgi:ABC-type Zn uptake system ZnuABC Zn-binding protein ZnuA
VGRTRGQSLAVRLTALAALAFTGLLATPPASVQGQTALTVTATLGIFADFARQVGGDRVEVVQLLGDGVDVHGYQMTPTDLVAINRSRLLLYNGFDLEPFLGQVLTGGARPGLTRVELAEGLTPAPLGRGLDPHFWLNPQFAARYVERIRDAFVAADPDGADTYRANAARYLDQLAALDAELESQLAQIPPQNRKLITNHDAFGYLARRYGFQVIGAVLSGEGRDPTPGEIIALVRQIRQAGVRTMFVEPQFNVRLLEQVARDGGVQILRLYSDAFPPDGSIRSYLDMMRANGRNLSEGLR